MFNAIKKTKVKRRNHRKGVVRRQLRLEELEQRLAPASFSLQQDWSELRNPDSPWSLNAGNVPLGVVDRWDATTGQGAWATGVGQTPAFFKAGPLVPDGTMPDDVIVQTTAPESGGGVANITWTSPADGLIQVSGDLWPAGAAVVNHTWTLFVGSRAVSTGTILGSEFSRPDPAQFALGSGGPGAVSNIAVARGDRLKLELTSSQTGPVGVDLSVSFNPTEVPQYVLGSIPLRVSAASGPVSFVVNPPEGQAGPVSMQVSGGPAGPVTFDQATGTFDYVPDRNDRFDFTVQFTAGGAGTWDAPTSQMVTISPTDVAPELSLVAVAKPVPDPRSLDYLTVSETTNELAPGSHFNAAPHTATRNVEVSGDVVDLVPGDPDGLFERYAYTDPNGRSAVNADIQNFSVYADTVVVGDHLWLPQTNVTIYARQLVFSDTAGGRGSIDTTALDYQTRADQFKDGVPGEKGGDITLHVGSVVVPPGSGGNRLILRGGRGQAAGEGAKGTSGQSMLPFAFYNGAPPDHVNVWVFRPQIPVVNYQAGGSITLGTNGIRVSFRVGLLNSLSLPSWRVSRQPEGSLTVTTTSLGRYGGPAYYVTYAPARHDEPDFTVIFSYGNSSSYSVTISPSSTVSGQFYHSIWGWDAWPTDGGPAVPGGTPGAGGPGGQLTIYSDAAVQQSLTGHVDLGGGEPGAPADNAPGGDPGTPVNAGWSDTHGEVASHTALPGPDWIAPASRSGAAGSMQSYAAAPGDWLHPAALTALISYIKDAYLGGNIQYAASTSAELGELLDSIVSPPGAFALPFSEARAEVAALQDQAANGLDYFGNPPGWAPSLSFAANYTAYSSQIDTDIRILYLTAVIQSAAQNQQDATAAMTKALRALDADVANAEDGFNTSEALLPDLQGQLAAIESQTTVVQQEIAAVESALEQRARNNVEDRHNVPAWQSALAIVSSVAKAIPIPTVQGIGVGLGTLSAFLTNPSLGKIGDTFKAITDPFKQDKLKDSAKAIDTQLAELKPPSRASRDDLEGYVKNLAGLGKQWGQVFNAYQQATTAAAVPATEVEAELARLKAEDPVFNQLAAQMSQLNAQKELFARDLAHTMEGISQAADQVTADYHAAESLNSQLSRMSQGLSLDALVQVRSMERDARDRLLQYQYDMAKAYEHEMLRPYPGNLQLSHLLDEVTRLLSPPVSADANWLDDPARFQALKAVYDDDLAETAGLIWASLNANAPARTSTITFKLAPSQVETLNTQGEVTINLVAMGFISPALQDVKLLAIGAAEVNAAVTGPPAQLANLRFEFEHSGIAEVQSAGAQYLFQYQSNSQDGKIFWATDYDALRRTLSQSEISPSQIATVTALLGLNPASLTADEAERLYAHPGAWGDITIRKTVTAVPARAAVDLKGLTLSVKYDSERPQPGTVVLDVRADGGLLPRIAVSQTDEGGHTDGLGSFVRYFGGGQTVTLTAEPVFGRFKFSQWQDAQGRLIGKDARLTLALNQDTQVHAVYKLTAGSPGGRPVIVTNPLSRTVNPAQKVTFTAIASGSPKPTVQWQVSVDGGATFANLPHAAATSLTVTAQAASNGFQYRALFSNHYGITPTTAATLTVNSAPTAPPQITYQPVAPAQPAHAGKRVTLVAGARGAAEVQWQVSADGVTYTMIAGANAPTYTLIAQPADNGLRYRAVFTNPFGAVPTSAVTLRVAPVVTRQPVARSVYAGQTVSFTAAERPGRADRAMAGQLVKLE